jgi:hypothetical protein
MRPALAAIFIGAGVAIASAFASSLGLTLTEQRIAFACGVLLVVVGIVLLIRKHSERSGSVSDKRSGDLNISGHVTQHGAGSVVAHTINFGTPPGIASEQLATNVLREGQYVTQARFRLSGSAEARGFHVVVTSPEPIDVSMEGDTVIEAGADDPEDRPTRRGLVRLQPLASEYVLTIRSAKPIGTVVVNSSLLTQ